MASYRSPLWRWRPGVVLPSLFLLLATLGPVLPVKDVRIVVPRAVELDKDAELRCLYNMEEDKLYQVKWYKGQDEFFRYTPAETPPEKIFDVKGVNVVMSKSDSQKVTLHKVGRETEGRYACEVSADGPSFATAMKEDRLIVVELPKDDPVIVGLEQRYRLGDWLRANCSTEPSHPPANLTILVNNRQYAPDEHVKNFKMKEMDLQGRRRSVVGIEMKLLQQHFGQDNKLKLRCLASIYDLYSKSDERSIERRQNHEVGPKAMEANQGARSFDHTSFYIVSGDWGQKHKSDRAPSSGDRPSWTAVTLVILVLVPLAAAAVWVR